ncbi:MULTISPECIES: helix-turn-helix domain-containing protein [Bacillus]|uniref:helix-turn-helix domain-containing protein n=1 Tax=Bacillus TaxID=1386 RepID=UPI00031AE95F|nr:MULTISPECIES: helix-turn-helix domain-containing protein [Bacillus]
MNYKQIAEDTILDSYSIKIAIFEEAKNLFLVPSAVLEVWKKEAYSQRDDPNDDHIATIKSQSFKTLYTFFTYTIYLEENITKGMIIEGMSKYHDMIRNVLEPHLKKEFDNRIFSTNADKIDEVMERNYLYSSSEASYQLLSDIVSKKSNYSPLDNGIYRAPIMDTKGNVKGLADVRPYELEEEDVPAEQKDLWYKLLQSTINSLDELTADLLDLISYLWMVSPKTSEGYIEFHSDDALKLRQVRKRTLDGKEFNYREEDRFNIMKRVAALSTIWVLLDEEQIKIVNTDELNKEGYRIKEFMKMFNIGKVRIAYDIKTDEPKGIYALEIKPTSVLLPYLNGNSNSLGVLNLKVFQYNHYTQREHKRLTRYLNYQWKIRTRRKTLKQPFKVGTLLNIMNISDSYSGVVKRDRFENVLDDLQKDNVIKHWRYEEPIDDNKVGKKGWFNDYWCQVKVLITPSDLVVKENQRIMKLSTIYDAESMVEGEYKFIETEQSLVSEPLNVGQQSFDFESQAEQETSASVEELVLSPELMQETLELKKISVRKAAAEIGIAHTTLSRYIKREYKRQNKSNDKKMLEWLKANTK